MGIRTPNHRGSRSGAAENFRGGHPRSIVVKHAAVASSLRYMAENYSRAFKIRDLARFSALSPRGFYKAFRKHVGHTPAQVLRQLRMEHAKSLLMEREVSLPELAAQCGYRSVNSFWVAFRQVTGVAPKRFRQQLRWQKQ